MLAIKLTGLGSYLPQRRVTSDELAARYGVRPGVIERATGVKERRYASGESSATMGAAAARAALADAELTIDDIDLIIGANAAPQQAIPCTAVFFQRELGGADGRSACFDINATCLSFVFALQTAAHLIAAGSSRRALVISSDIASVSLNPYEWESSVLFGDAAAAVVVEAAPPDEGSALWLTHHATYSSGAEHTQISGGGTLHHPNDPATTPGMNLFAMEGPAIFRFALKTMEPFVERFFEQLGWERSTIAKVIPHQASRHAIDQFSARLGFSPEQVYSNIAERGNCVAASIPLALVEAAASGAIKRGDRVVLMGTGAGLTYAALALTF